MPEFDEVDVNFHPKDTVFTTMRSGGAGGRNVNKVETAVALIYTPIDIWVKCTKERI